MLVTPRDLDTLEMPLSLTLPATTFITHEKGNPSIGFVEALSIIAGYTDLNALRVVAPRTFDAGYFRYNLINYPERIKNQWDRVIQTLKMDRYSRRAVMTIANSAIDRYSELPCPQTFQVLYRNNELHGHLHMRSLDVVRGLPNDFLVWSTVLQVLAWIMDFDVGTLTITCPCAHMYMPYVTAQTKMVQTGHVVIDPTDSHTGKECVTFERLSYIFGLWLQSTPTWNNEENGKKVPNCFIFTQNRRPRDILPRFTKEIKLLCQSE